MAQEYPLFANQYRLVRRVAAGGMGEVYLAIDEGPRGPRQVAIKRMLPGATETDAIFTSFMDELRLAPRLNHANIVRVLNHGQAEDMHFMAMEYIDGRNLFELVSRAVKTGRSIDFSAALQIVHDVAAGAHYAHTLTDESGAPLGVVHRDLNPRNIMVTTDGVTKLLDFGVAKAATQANETLPGVVKGTPSYLAPEQLAGTPATLRTDIFAMGILLWELTTVRRLFRRASMMESMRAVLACEVPAPSSLVPDYPAVIEPIALRALARRPADRYASAMEMRLDIIKALAQLRPTGEAREQVAALVRDLNEPSMPVEIGPPEEPTMAEQTAAVSVSVSALSVDPAAERGNLPPEDGRLIGRARELKQLASLLDKRPIVSLYGPPGGGKTRLALELGRDRLASGTTGVYLCELESAQTRGDVCAVVGSAMRLSLDASDESVIDVFAEALAERGETLVILDGIEHVAEAVWDVVASWSAAAPQARFIVTCRQRMKRKGATSMEVEPLSLEASGDAAWSPAVELFIDRARLKVPDFAPRPKQLAEIRRITRHLDGIPLAIQLAASRMPELSSSALLRDLVRKPDALSAATTAVVGPGRHAALGAALDWSWQQLEPWEQAALAQCSVFHGGFDLEAADAVVDLSGYPDAPWVVDVLQALKDKSLMRVWYAPEFADEPRCRQYVSVRAFARNKLEARGLVGPAMERHTAFYQQFGTFWAGAPTVEGLRRLRLDRNNVLAAHRRALANAADPASMAQAIDLVLALAPIIMTEGPYESYLQVLDELIARPETQRTDAVRRARLLTTRGHVRRIQGHPIKAIEDCRAAATLADQAGARLMLAEAVTEWGITLQAAGQFEDAGEVLKRALRMHGESRSPGQQGRALLHLGSLYLSQGAEERAVACLEKALPRFRTVNDALREGHCLVQLGSLAHAGGEQEAAAQHLQRAIVLLREIGAPRFEAYACANLGAVLHEQGDLGGARDLYARSLTLSRDVGDRRWESVSSGYLSLLQLQSGATGEARQLAEAAVKLADRSGDRRWAVLLRGVAAAAEAMDGRPNLATKLLEQARTGAARIEDPALEPLLQLAELFRLLGEGKGASTTLLRDRRKKDVAQTLPNIARRIRKGRWKAHTDRMDLCRMMLTTLERAVS